MIIEQEPTILLIEDEPQMRRGMTTALEMEGFKVTAVANGRLGVAAALREPPEMILCDGMMP